MSLRPPVSEKDHIQGSKEAPIELVEYGDYQCPHCGRAYYPQAMMAAITSEAAALQNMFWPMHDLLFENQRRLFKSAILGYAGELSLDMNRFEKDMADPEIEKAIGMEF